MAASDTDVCTVGGTLAVVLQISRIHGVASVNLEPHGDTYTARISYPAILYSRILYIAIIILTLVGVILELPYYGTNEALKLGTFSSAVLWLLDIGITNMVVGYAVWKVGHRMKRIFLYLKEIEKVYKVIAIDSIPRRISCNVGLITLLIILYTLCVMDFVYNFLISYIINVTKKIFLYSYIFHYIEYCKTFCLIMQLTFVVVEIQSAFRAVNNGFQELIHLQELKELSFKNLADSYTCLCDVVTMFNEDNGLLIVLLLSATAGYLLKSIYAFVVSLCIPENAGELAWIVVLLSAIQLSCLLYQFIVVSILIEPCHRLHKEMDKTQVLLVKLMYSVTKAGDPIPTELDVLHNRLVLHKPTISPLNICTLHRNYNFAVIGGLTTYLLFIVQNHIVNECRF